MSFIRASFLQFFILFTCLSAFGFPHLGGAYYETYDQNLIKQTEEGAPFSPTLDEKTKLDGEQKEEKPGRPIPKSTIPETRPITPYLPRNPVPPQKLEVNPLKAKSLKDQGLIQQRIPRNQLKNTPLNASQLPKSALPKNGLKSNRLPSKDLPKTKLQKNPLR